jgi:MFS family permease
MDLGWSAAATSIPWLASRQFHATANTLGDILGASTLVYTVAALSSGQVARWLSGRTRTLIFAAIVSAAYLCGEGIHNLLELTLLLCVGSAGLGSFWPAVQSQLTADCLPEVLKDRVAGFNFAWSLGVVAGPLVSSRLYLIAPRLPILFFGICAGVSGLILALPGRRRSFSTTLISLPGGIDAPCTKASTAVSAAAAAAIPFILFAAWCAHGASFFCSANIRAFFPLLATRQGISVPAQANVLFALAAWQTVTFFLLSYWDGWQIRRSTFGFAIVLMIGGMLLTTVAAFPVHFAAFAILGVGTSVGYSLSLYYSLHSDNPSRNSGIHEGIVGGASLCGNVAGGNIAHAFGLEAPFFLCAAGVAALAIPITLLLRAARNQTAAGAPSPSS